MNQSSTIETFYSDENSEEDFEDWDSIGLNVSKPPNLLRLFRDFKRHVAPTKSMSEESTQTSPDVERERLQLQASQLQLEVEELRQRSGDNDTVIVRLKVELSKSEARHQQLVEEFEQRLEDHQKRKISEKIESPDNLTSESSVSTVEPFSREGIPVRFFEHVSGKCCPRTTAGSDTGGSVLSDRSFERVIALLSNSLPKIVPNVLLAKRDELIPLLLLSIRHDDDEKRRDQLLNLLFNLIKRPDGQQRAVIIAGFEKIAETFPERIESELLPQIWEQIGHKYVERRILIAETCSVLLPKIPAPLRNSLVFSILNQLISDDRDIQVTKVLMTASVFFSSTSQTAHLFKCF